MMTAGEAKSGQSMLARGQRGVEGACLVWGGGYFLTAVPAFGVVEVVGKVRDDGAERKAQPWTLSATPPAIVNSSTLSSCRTGLEAAQCPLSAVRRELARPPAKSR